MNDVDLSYLARAAVRPLISVLSVPRQDELLHLDGQIAIRVPTPFIKTA